MYLRSWTRRPCVPISASTGSNSRLSLDFFLRGRPRPGSAKAGGERGDGTAGQVTPFRLRLIWLAGELPVKCRRLPFSTGQNREVRVAGQFKRNVFPNNAGSDLDPMHRPVFANRDSGAGCQRDLRGRCAVFETRNRPCRRKKQRPSEHHRGLPAVYPCFALEEDQRCEQSTHDERSRSDENDLLHGIEAGQGRLPQPAAFSATFTVVLQLLVRALYDAAQALCIA